MKTKLRWLLPAIFTGWMFFTLVPLTLFGSQLPVLVTNLLSLAVLPFFPLLPILTKFHLTSGEYGFNLPTSTGFIVAIAFYNVLLYFLGCGIERFRK